MYANAKQLSVRALVSNLGPAEVKEHGFLPAVMYCGRVHGLLLKKSTM